MLFEQTFCLFTRPNASELGPGALHSSRALNGERRAPIPMLVRVVSTKKTTPQHVVLYHVSQHDIKTNRKLNKSNYLLFDGGGGYTNPLSHHLSSRKYIYKIS